MVWNHYLISHICFSRKNGRACCIIAWKSVNNNRVAHQRHSATGFFCTVSISVKRVFHRQDRCNHAKIESPFPMAAVTVIPLFAFLAKRRYYEWLEPILDRSRALRPFTVHRLRKQETCYVTDTLLVLAVGTHLLISDNYAKNILFSYGKNEWHYPISFKIWNEDSQTENHYNIKIVKKWLLNLITAAQSWIITYNVKREKI